MKTISIKTQKTNIEIMETIKKYSSGDDEILKREEDYVVLRVNKSINWKDIFYVLSTH